MTTIRALITRYPVPTYFALTFALSWGGVLIVVGPDRIPGTSEQLETLFPFAFLAMLVGPSVAGVLLTGVVYRKPGFRDVFSRLLEWRVAPQWYAVALLTAPLLMTATLFALSLTSPLFLPGVLIASDKATVLLAGLVVGLGAGVFEELGWTGFAIPTLRRRYGVLTTGLIVGVLWGAWHLLTNVFWASSSSAEISRWPSFWARVSSVFWLAHCRLTGC